MKILHVIHSANPLGGGPIEAVKQYARVHVRDGHHVELATMDMPTAAWLNEFPFAVTAFGRSRSSYGFTPLLVPWLVERRKDFDVVVSHGLWQFNGAGVRHALHRTATPYTVFPHGMLDPWFKRRYPGKHMKKWAYWLAVERRVLKDAEAVFFTCEEERLLARQSFAPYGCHERVVAFGTARSGGDPDAQRAAFFEKFPHLEGKRFILFLGRIHEKKGCRELLETYRRISLAENAGRALPHLVMAGPADDVYGHELKQLSAQQEGVTWTGMLTGDLKWGAFRACEAFILPSHQENFGIAVAEALACGVPVLISNKVNIWREIEAAGAGLVEDDSVDGTTRLLHRWERLSEGERQALKDAAVKCFSAKFEVEAAARDLAGALEHIVHRRKQK